MTVHLIKVCVGAEGVEDLLDWQETRFGDGLAVHVTRMWPKRKPEVLDGGSLYWVFKGLVLARQCIVGLEPHCTEDGVTRCAVLLHRTAVRVRPVPRRPFQGWRYLKPQDAPPDLPLSTRKEPELPPKLVAELVAIGVW